jgi:hypothetical protein
MPSDIKKYIYFDTQSHTGLNLAHVIIATLSEYVHVLTHRVDEVRAVNKASNFVATSQHAAASAESRCPESP